MMVCVLVHLLTLLLTASSASLSSSGTQQASACPPSWLLFGTTCFSFFPVWSSWSAADSMCTQTGSNLASLHTPEERQFVRQLTNTHTPVWLGGPQTRQNDSWFLSEDSALRISGWTNQRQGKAREGGACMTMTPTSGELQSAPCGDLRFYICARASFSTSDRKPVEPGLVPGVRLFDVVWSFSDSLADEIFRSSSFLQQLRSGRLTQRCHAGFIQQEALYLRRVSSTLEALISRLQEADDVRSLLLDTLKRYSSRNQSLLTSPPPPWLLSSLQSFHSVVLEEPVYWLVALSARACLQDLIFSELRRGARLVSEADVNAGGLHHVWSEDALMEVAWIRRYRQLIQQHQHHMDVFKAVNIFREHMRNQKSFHKALVCDEEEDR